MKTTLLLVALATALCAQSQNYYKNGVPAWGGPITFNVKLDDHSMVLSNINNTKDDEGNLFYKDGTVLATEGERNEVCLEVAENSQYEALEATFNYEDLLPLCPLKGTPLSIYYVVSPEGKTLEVAFIIDAVPEMLAIPPWKYAELERNLKKYGKWKLNDFAQKLQFVSGFDFIRFKNIRSQLPLITPVVGKPPTAPQ